MDILKEISFLVSTEGNRILVLIGNTPMSQDKTVSAKLSGRNLNIEQDGVLYASAAVNDDQTVNSLRSRAKTPSKNFDDFLIVESTQSGVKFFKKSILAVS